MLQTAAIEICQQFDWEVPDWIGIHHASLPIVLQVHIKICNRLAPEMPNWIKICCKGLPVELQSAIGGPENRCH